MIRSSAAIARSLLLGSACRTTVAIPNVMWETRCFARILKRRLKGSQPAAVATPNAPRHTVHSTSSTSGAAASTPSSSALPAAPRSSPERSTSFLPIVSCDNGTRTVRVEFSTGGRADASVVDLPYAWILDHDATLTRTGRAQGPTTEAWAGVHSGAIQAIEWGGPPLSAQSSPAPAALQQQRGSSSSVPRARHRHKRKGKPVIVHTRNKIVRAVPQKQFLQVAWSDGRKSSISAASLQQARPQPEGQGNENIVKWNAGVIGAVPAQRYDGNAPSALVVENYYRDTTAQRPRVFRLLEKYGVAIVVDPALTVMTPRALRYGLGAGAVNAPASRRKAAEQLISSIFDTTSFEGVKITEKVQRQRRSKDMEKGGKTRDRDTLPGASPTTPADGLVSEEFSCTLHTSRSWASQPPRIAAIAPTWTCGQQPATFLCDGWYVAQQLRESLTPAQLSSLSTVPMTHRNHVDTRRDLAAAHPVLGTVYLPCGNDSSSSAVTSMLRVTFNDFFRSPFQQSSAVQGVTDLRLLYEAYGNFCNCVNRPDNLLKLTLRVGECLIVDNWRVLRGLGKPAGDYVACSVFVSQDDYRCVASPVLEGPGN